MKVLVTGGTGLVGEETIRWLLAKGHEVRLLTRHAERDAEKFGPACEPAQGSVQNQADVQGVAEGCDAILHIAGIVREDPPDTTFEKVNVGGTRNLLDEAERAGVQRFIYVSSLGADTGTSDYHRSKLDSENLVRTFSRDWLICRPGGVYGPGGETISVLLNMLQRLPAVPMVNWGTNAFQPLWHEDLAEALALCVERDDLHHQVLLMAGSETTTMQEVLSRLSKKLNKPAVGVPVPEPLAELGARALNAVGIEAPIAPDQLRMVVDGNSIETGQVNAVTDTLGLQPISLDEGLDRLLKNQPEQKPEDGVGKTLAQRFAVRIDGAQTDAKELFDRFASDPSAAFEGTPVKTSGSGKLELEEILNLELPLGRMLGVRVTERTDNSAACQTLEGHPLAGTVRFCARQEGEGLVFEVETLDRPATTSDAILMNTVGRTMQEATWRQVLQNVVRMSGGRQSGDLMVHKSEASMR